MKKKKNNFEVCEGQKKRCNIYLIDGWKVNTENAGKNQRIEDWKLTELKRHKYSDIRSMQIIDGINKLQQIHT